MSSSLRAELALDALEMAIWSRRSEDLAGLVHHSDRGVQYLAIRYTERLADAGAVNSVGSRGDSYDNALAETVNGLYKTELIRARGPWRTADQVELATAELSQVQAVSRWSCFTPSRWSCFRLTFARVRGGLPSAPTGDHRGRLKPNHLGLHETQGGSLPGGGRRGSGARTGSSTSSSSTRAYPGLTALG